jgi:NTE family protein
MTTAFVLSGGGNLGAVQVGMMLALERAGVRPDLIVGTSVGAVNGGWLAAAQPAEELAQVWRGLRRRDVFPVDLAGGFLGLVGRRNHLVSPRGLRRLLRRHQAFERLEDAPVPLHVVATDVLTGLDVRLSSGPTVEAILASSAIPGVYPPVRYDGQTLMDGGVVNNTPISHAAALGADQVWVLTTGYACALSRAPGSALGMALHAVAVIIQQRMAFDVARYADRLDMRVVPQLCPIRVSPTDFSRTDELISRAEAQTTTWLESRMPGRATLQLHQHG